MSQVFEVNDDGNLTLPGSVLRAAKPHTRYEVDVQGNALVLRPVGQEPLWMSASADEWIDAFLNWVNGPRPAAPLLPDEVLRRESIYD